MKAAVSILAVILALLLAACAPVIPAETGEPSPCPQLKDCGEFQGNIT